MELELPEGELDPIEPAPDDDGLLLGSELPGLGALLDGEAPDDGNEELPPGAALLPPGAAGLGIALLDGDELLEAPGAAGSTSMLVANDCPLRDVR